jgi:hypothetical protein
MQIRAYGPAGKTVIAVMLAFRTVLRVPPSRPVLETSRPTSLT